MQLGTNSEAGVLPPEKMPIHPSIFAMGMKHFPEIGVYMSVQPERAA